MAGTSRHALIIEDEMLVGMDMQSVLSEIGFDSFAFASTALQALHQARLRRPDLVTADIALLDGDGLEACQALVAECGPLPIIYVTGQPELTGEQGRTVVPKPYTPADIAKAYAQVTGEIAAA
jgi:two-component system, response regulator PdtaR